jgi:hypothetical protein
MLAKAFKSAAELGIPEHEHAGLCHVLYLMEDGKIKPDWIVMRSFGETRECGTAHCIAGWVNHFNKKAFPEAARSEASSLVKRLPRELTKLFGIDHYDMLIDGAKVPAALRSYLETGKCPV